MTKGDFFASEQSSVVAKDGSVKIEHIATDGTVTVLKVYM
jgi:isocitrate dehydrogenase